MTRRLYAGLVVLVVVLAGCMGAPTGSSPTSTATSTDDATGAESASMDGGQVNFYVSDERNAIGDFRHLNVTVTKVGFHRGGENGTWVEEPVDNVTVDLTELQGENATLVDSYDLPNGTYTKVFLHVSDVDGTLNATGEETNVKLPSQKLQLNQQFAVENGSEVDFVFDITVVKAGNSGKYVLKPVVSESGTDVPIRKTGDLDDDGDEREGGEEQTDSLHAAFVGDVTRGENATVHVTRESAPVENATVFVDDEEVGETDATGNITVSVDADASELTVRVVDGDQEAELEVEFEEETESETETPTATPTPS